MLTYVYLCCAQSQQERRPPSAGFSGQQAQRTYSDNRSAEKDNDANVQLKTAGHTA